MIRSLFVYSLGFAIGVTLSSALIVYGQRHLAPPNAMEVTL